MAPFFGMAQFGIFGARNWAPSSKVDKVHDKTDRAGLAQKKDWKNVTERLRRD